MDSGFIDWRSSSLPKKVRHDVGGLVGLPANHVLHANIVTDYSSRCEMAGVRPNSELMALLEKKDPIEHLSLSRNLVGDRGLPPFLETASAFGLLDDITSVDVKGNGLRNQGIRTLLETLRSSHHLATLDLSCNVISDAIGRFLLDWVATKPMLMHVHLLGTNIDITIRRKIYTLMERRRQVAAEAEAEMQRALAASMVANAPPAHTPEKKGTQAEWRAMQQMGLDKGWDVGRWFPAEPAQGGYTSKPSATMAASRSGFDHSQPADFGRTVGAKPSLLSRDGSGGRSNRDSQEPSGGVGGLSSRSDFSRFGRTLSHPAQRAESDMALVPTPPTQDKRAFEATFPRSTNARQGIGLGF